MFDSCPSGGGLRGAQLEGNTLGTEAAHSHADTLANQKQKRASKTSLCWFNPTPRSGKYDVLVRDISFPDHDNGSVAVTTRIS